MKEGERKAMLEEAETDRGNKYSVVHLAVPQTSAPSTSERLFNNVTREDLWEVRAFNMADGEYYTTFSPGGLLWYNRKQGTSREYERNRV